MNDKEITERLAKMMGWEVRKHTNMTFLSEKDWKWIDKDGLIVCNYNELPDWNHLWMVVEKFLSSNTHDFSWEFCCYELMESSHMRGLNPNWEFCPFCGQRIEYLNKYEYIYSTMRDEDELH